MKRKEYGKYRKREVVRREFHLGKVCKMLTEKVKVDPQEKHESVTDIRGKSREWNENERQQEHNRSTEAGRRFTGFQKIYRMMSDVVLKWEWRDQCKYHEEE